MNLDQNERYIIRTMMRLKNAPFIMVYRVFIEITGSLDAGVFLSQLSYWTDALDDLSDGVSKSQEEWQAATGLSRYEQETARSRLRELGLLIEERRGIPARLRYYLDGDLLGEMVFTAIDRAANKSARNSHTGDSSARNSQSGASVSRTPARQKPAISLSNTESNDEESREDAPSAPRQHPASRSINLAPIADAFRERGISVTFPADQIRAAQMLLSDYAPADIAGCWQDIATGAYGDQYARENLSFRYLAGNMRVANWKRQLAETGERSGKGNQDGPSNQGRRNGSGPGRGTEKRKSVTTGYVPDSGSEYAQYYRPRVRGQSGASGVRPASGDDPG